MDVNLRYKHNITTIMYLKPNKNQKERRVTIGKPHYAAKELFS